MSNLKMTIYYYKNKPFINVYIHKIRYRFWNGESIETNIKCIENPALLIVAFELKLREVWRPQPKKNEIKEVPITFIQALQKGEETKRAQGYF
jgi:hypothetical protein